MDSKASVSIVMHAIYINQVFPGAVAAHGPKKILGSAYEMVSHYPPAP